jgi:hypothetical protein
LPPAKEVRNALAGFADGQFADWNLFPRSAEAVTINGLRGLCFRGDVLNKPKGAKFLATMVFGKEVTYYALGYGREALAISVLEDHSGVSGDPLPDTSYITKEMIAHLNAGIPHFQELILRANAENNKANDSSQSTAPDVAPPASPSAKAMADKGQDTRQP